MFETIRNHRRWMQFVLLVLILPSFVFVGVQGYSSFMEGDRPLAKVAGAGITQQEYDAAARNRLEQLRGMLGAQFDASLFDTPEMRKAVLDELINARVIAAEAADKHYAASVERLRDTIQRIPAVQENGVFSAERYREALAAQGMTPAMFEAQLQRDLSLQQVLAPLAESALVPDVVLDRLLAAATERRDVQLLRIDAASFRAKAEVSDADVQAYYDANQARFRVPERVDAQFVVLDASAIKDAGTVTDADVQGFYEQNRARYTQQEERRASHILLSVDSGASESDREAVRKKAEALAAQAKAPGADFAALARANSQDPGSAANGGDLDWFGRGMMTKSFEDAVFAMKEGQVSDVVPTEFGYHIIRLTGERPAVAKPLAEVRSQIVDEIRQQQAARRFAEAAEQFTNTVYEQSDSLEPVADRFGLTVQRVQGVTREGGPQAGEALGQPRALQALFSDEVLREKRNSGVIELGPNRLLALRADKVEPATVRPLADVSASIRAQLVQERAVAQAEEAGKARLQALKEKDATAGFGPVRTVSRSAPEDVPAAVLDAVMKAPAKALPAFVGASTGDAYVIARVAKVEAAPAPDAAQRANEKSMMERRWAQAEQLAALETLRTKHKVQVTEAGKRLIER